MRRATAARARLDHKRFETTFPRRAMANMHNARLPRAVWLAAVAAMVGLASVRAQGEPRHALLMLCVHVIR